MERFLEFVAYPILTAGIIGLLVSAIRAPQIFKVVVPWVIFTCFLWVTAISTFDFGIAEAQIVITHKCGALGIPTDQAEAISAAVAEHAIPWWIIGAMVALLFLIVLSASIAEKIHGYAIFGESEPKGAPKDDAANSR